MTTNKAEEFSVRDNRLAKLCKALSHPARIAILRILAQRNSCYCGDIVEELPLSQSTVSQHLKELKEAGIITGEVEGVKVCYCIDFDEWKQNEQMLSEFFKVNFALHQKCC
jgi:DNA-binding transcriptional ArsR family regulator